MVTVRQWQMQLIVGLALAAGSCALVWAWPMNLSAAVTTHSPTRPLTLATTRSRTATQPDGSLADLDVDLRRPLFDSAAAPPDAASAPAAPPLCVLLGTSIDEREPMALLQTPDGSSQWLAVGQSTKDGLTLQRLGRRAATVLLHGKSIELTLHETAP